MAENIEEIPNIIATPSILGPHWCGIFETDIDFGQEHFETAMGNLIRQPNINSTVILRADILKENEYGNDNGELVHETTDEDLISSELKVPIDIDQTPTSPTSILQKNLSDLELREIPSSYPLTQKNAFIRRIIPRNPFKDVIINQTCLIMRNNEEEATLVAYIPHIDTAEEIPFYLPPVAAVGILYQKGKLSVHYLPFQYKDLATVEAIRSLPPQDRSIRIAYRLLNTAKKHSIGVMNGYKKRVKHDQVVSKVAFQDTYIALKKKYSKQLVENWAESTDPKKHVFEDLAIAAFLIQLWANIYPAGKNSFEFRDLGCGNGLLVYILMMEGYKGVGIDARTRKSWKTYPSQVQSCLKEQVIIPSVLLRPHPAYKSMMPELQDNGRVFNIPITTNNHHSHKSTSDIQLPPIDAGNIPIIAYYSSANLINSPQVNLAEFAPNTFIIGNHSDELTCWIPLLGYPFMVIPCCSHNLAGARVRYQSQRNAKTSMYAGLCEKVEFLSKLVGWQVKTEMLRIPSTRNMALIGTDKVDPMGTQVCSVYDVLAMEGGAEGWVENSMALMKRPPRNH